MSCNLFRGKVEAQSRSILKLKKYLCRETYIALIAHFVKKKNVLKW
jgi:hypothetical protein